MPNIVSQTQHSNSPPPKQNSLRNIEEFLSKEVGVPLTLGKIQIYKDPSPAKSINGKRASTDTPPKHYQTQYDEVHFGDFLSTVWSWQTKAPVENDAAGISDVLEGLVDRVHQTILEKVERVVSLLYDQYQDPKTSHCVFVERTHVCKDLRKEIQDLAVESFKSGLECGRHSGLVAIRKFLGTSPKSSRIYKFSTREEHHLSGRGDLLDCAIHRCIGVKLENISSRMGCDLPDLEQQAKTTWSFVEKQVALLVEFKLRSVLNAIGAWSENTKHLRECISNAIRATFDAGKYCGYHHGQEKYKEMHGISNPWIYSHADMDSEDATVLSMQSRPTPKIIHPSFAKRQRKI